MKVSLKWLREYVDITLPAEELAAKLTASGTEVAGITRTGGGWGHVQVARVTTLQRRAQYPGGPESALRPRGGNPHRRAHRPAGHANGRPHPGRGI